MIRNKLLYIKCNALEDPENNERKIKAVEDIKQMISQIDHDAEIIPLENCGKLTELLASLKSSPLTQDEILVIQELIIS